MKLHPIISNRAPRLGFVCTPETNTKAKEEAATYAWYVISPGLYACQSNDQVYVIEETAKTTGCSCPVMSFRGEKNNSDVCKHVVAMSFLDEPPTTPLTNELKKLFRFEGWIGENFLIPPSAYQRQGTKKKTPPKPEPEPEAKPTDAKPATVRQERTNTQDRWKGLSPAEMCQSMDDAELRKNARRGGVAAIAEVARRKQEKEAA